jgi:hypothetical protein
MMNLGLCHVLSFSTMTIILCLQPQHPMQLGQSNVKYHKNCILQFMRANLATISFIFASPFATLELESFLQIESEIPAEIAKGTEKAASRSPVRQKLQAQHCHLLSRTLFVDQQIEQSLPESHVPIALERSGGPSFQNTGLGSFLC